jgi:hypothetical protein
MASLVMMLCFARIEVPCANCDASDASHKTIETIVRGDKQREAAWGEERGLQGSRMGRFHHYNARQQTTAS